MYVPFFQQINHRQHQSLTTEWFCMQQHQGKFYHSHKLYVN